MSTDSQKLYKVTFQPIVEITVCEDGTLFEKSIDFSASWTGDIFRYDKHFDDEDSVVVEDNDEMNKAIELADAATDMLDLEQRFIQYKEFGNEPF